MDQSGTKIIEVDIEKEMKEAYLDYSMSVIVRRALPDVRDGLKPVHRRILYTMYEKGLLPEREYRKCADTVGSVLGSYHPHGDGSVYDALVRMAQNFSLRHPLVEGQGNFGSVDGDPPAAYRYTEAKMSKISSEMLADIDKETVDFISNYDDRLKEPAYLPARFPNLLVNGSSGIAVGMATEIPPHNLNEVIDALFLLIDNPDAEMIELMEHIKGPDFPTGGIIMGHSGIRAAYATGRGKIVLRAKAEIVEKPDGRFRILVTEIPYMVKKAEILIEIGELVKEKRVEGISALNDESSDRVGMRMVIDLKRDANPQIVLNQLYMTTKLQKTVGIINLALVKGQPRELTLKEMLSYYLEHQLDVVTRRTQFELKKAKERAHILEGLKVALEFIDEVIAILRSSKSIPEGKERLMERFELDDIQAGAIVSMRLGQLTGLEREKIENELAELKDKIAEFLDILANEDKLYGIIREELTEVKQKFGNERRTEIAAVSGEVDIEDLITREECVITLTHYGYIKRQTMDNYKTQRRGGRGVSGMKHREEDFVEEMFICNTHDDVLFITNRGKMYKLKGYEVPEGGRIAKGVNIINLLPLESEEKITSMIKVSEFDPEHYLMMVTRKGTIKRTGLIAYRKVRKNGLRAITLDEGDELAWVRLTDGSCDVLVATRKGYAIRFNENDARPLSRTARGVRAIRLRDGDEVVGMSRVREGGCVMTVTEKGAGRRTPVEEYRLQSRGGYGSINYKVSQSKGGVCGIKVVDDTDDLILISDDGVIIRIKAAEVGKMSRYAGGVRVMRLNGDAKIVTLARAPQEQEETEEIQNQDE